MAQRNPVSVSIMPNEIVFPAASIVVTATEPLDGESAQGGLGVRGVRGTVRLSRGGRVAIWRPEGEMTVGQQRLVIDGLVTARGKRIEYRAEIAFFVTDSKAKPPSHARVESLARLRVGSLGVERIAADRRPAGKYIEMLKATHRRTGAALRLAYDQDGRGVDTGRIFERILRNRAQRFGNLHATLHARLRAMKGGELVPVALWLRGEPPLDLAQKKEKGETVRPPAAERTRRRKINEITAAFAEQLRSAHRVRACRADAVAPVVYATLTRKEAEAIAARPEVAGAFLHEIDGIEDLGDSMAIANSDDVHAQGIVGAGIKVAVWENAPDDTTDLAITARFKSSGLTPSDHSRHTHAIVKNIERGKPRGHARGCSLHSANTKGLDALRWAAQEKGCTVISQSFHRSSEPGSDSLSFDDIYKDWLALQWPYPTICQAAGNFFVGDPDGIDPPSSEFVNHKGYNSLAVGNHNDGASAMSGSSVFRNPSSPHGDRELPEIAANGTGVTAAKLTKSGTSMAAPALAGCAALIQEVDATLKSWPEGCRAILLAGAKRNIAGQTWWQDVVGNVDAADGAGAVDALEATAIARQRRSRNAAGTRRGWDVGTLRSADIGAGDRTTFSYFVTLPGLALGPRHVKVALAWDSRISILSILGLKLPIASTLTVDLDLQVFDSRGNQVGYSGSWDNSYEIAEFDGQPGETYTIKIRRWSGTDAVWFGIGWTVTGGLIWSDATRFSVLEARIGDRRA